MTKKLLTIRAVGPRDPLLAEVISLGEKNSKTLGMFPQGAFMDHAKRKTIHAAVHENSLAGYVLFRIVHSKRLVSITHLCIAAEHRKKGVARLLLNSIKEKYGSVYQGMILTCREDYVQPSKLWEKFGFKPIDRRRSKSKDEHYLTKWSYDFGNPDLFSDGKNVDRTTRALLDCSVLIPMSESPSNEQIEVKPLFADWLQEEVDFFYAQEMFNELNRDQNKSRAAKTRIFFRKLNVVKFNPDHRDKILGSLSSMIPGRTINDISDRTQLAECISGGSNTLLLSTNKYCIIATSCSRPTLYRC